MNKKVAIIGAGLTGLSAGIYLQQKGIETEIFELSGNAGGMCTTWVRGRYRFDGCIHWMVGTLSGDAFYKMYLEVGALEADTPIYHAKSLQTEIEGALYEVPFQFEPFRQFLLQLSPQDEKKIENFCAAISAMGVKKPDGLGGYLGFTKQLIPFMRVLKRYTSMTVREYAEGFQSQTIRSLLYDLMPPQYTVVGLFMMMGKRMCGNGGYPLGGAYDVIGRMEHKYRSLGGKTRFNSKVAEIVVENGKAVGVKSGDQFHAADVVIAACDMYDTLYRMLDGKYHHEQLETMLNSAELFEPLLIVSFGLKQKVGIPDALTFTYAQGIETSPGLKADRIFLRSFDFDPSAAPNDGSSVMVHLASPLEYWQNLRQENKEEYLQQKKNLADAVAKALEDRFPGFTDAIEVVDVATPATYVRYANLYRGSWEGFAPTPEHIRAKIKNTVEGVDSLYLAGQWTTVGGGICTAVKSGKDTAQAISRAFK